MLHSLRVGRQLPPFPPIRKAFSREQGDQLARTELLRLPFPPVDRSSVRTSTC